MKIIAYKVRVSMPGEQGLLLEAIGTEPAPSALTADVSVTLVAALTSYFFPPIVTWAGPHGVGIRVSETLTLEFGFPSTWMRPAGEVIQYPNPGALPSLVANPVNATAAGSADGPMTTATGSETNA